MTGNEHFLSEKNTDKNPFNQFSVWYREAQSIGLTHTDAVVLATSTKEGKPSARIVLLKSFDDNGFVFFTNYSSRKAKELGENPFASLLFYWEGLSKQVRIEGKIEKILKSESEEYFKTRPRGSRLGAMSSNQSSVIESREQLEKKYEELDMKFRDKEIPLPDFWGGYRLIPGSFEFWQSRENRLHDRILYLKDSGGWKIMRLAP